VFALFWLLIVVLLKLIALGPLFIFFHALIGAAGAEELIPEYTTPTTSPQRTTRPQVHAQLILKYLLGIAK
jgi:hypothetical protein